MSTLTSREFNQDTGRAKRAARDGPVVITDRGAPAHVLLTYEDYRRLTGGAAPIGALLHWPGAAEIGLPETRSADRGRPAEFG